MSAGRFKPGEKVPITGIYTASHYQHRMPHEVFAVAGDTFPVCRRCSTRVNFMLLHAASHIEADQDFSKSSNARPSRAKAGSSEDD